MLYNNYTTQEYKSHHVIIPSTNQRGALLLGDLNAATDQQVIKLNNIKTIITASNGLQHLQIPSQLTHIVFPLMDTKQQNIQVYFDVCYKTIQENLKKGSVLVHCGAGISRSASLIIAYYMKKFNSTFKNAINHVKRIKPNVCPNLGFELQLKNYQNQLNLQKEKDENTSFEINKVSKKQNKVFSPYEFQIPLKVERQMGRKPGSQGVNKLLNKTYGHKMHSNKIENKSELFIQGKNATEKQVQFQKYNESYHPQNYTRKNKNKERDFLQIQKQQQCEKKYIKF